MPAVTADTLTLPRLPDLHARETAWRPVVRTISAQRFLEGEGFAVRRPFPGVDLALADPFVLLDHLGALEYAPARPRAPRGTRTAASRRSRTSSTARSRTRTPPVAAG